MPNACCSSTSNGPAYRGLQQDAGLEYIVRTLHPHALSIRHSSSGGPCDYLHGKHHGLQMPRPNLPFIVFTSRIAIVPLAPNMVAPGTCPSKLIICQTLHCPQTGPMISFCYTVRLVGFPALRKNSLLIIITIIPNLEYKKWVYAAETAGGDGRQK